MSCVAVVPDLREVREGKAKAENELRDGDLRDVQWEKICGMTSRPVIGGG